MLLLLLMLFLLLLLPVQLLLLNVELLSYPATDAGCPCSAWLLLLASAAVTHPTLLLGCQAAKCQAAVLHCHYC
jgi:hypothetical protein